MGKLENEMGCKKEEVVRKVMSQDGGAWGGQRGQDDRRNLGRDKMVFSSQSNTLLWHSSPLNCGTHL